VRFLAAVLFLLASLGLVAYSGVGHAMLTIEICGGSNTACSTPTSPNDSGTAGKSIFVDNYNLPLLATTIPNISMCNGSGKCIAIPLNATSPDATPSGWSGPTSPPATATQTTTFQSANVGVCGGIMTGTSANDVANKCSSYCASHFAPSNCTTCSVTSTNWNYRDTSAGQTCPGAGNVALSSSGTCPAGYTVSGANCNLSNASLVQRPPNNLAAVKSSGGTLACDSQDTADCTTDLIAPIGTLSGGVLSGGTAGQDAYTIAGRSGGGIKLDRYFPDGADQVHQVVEVDGTGQVVGTRQERQTGQGTQAVAGSTASPTTQKIDETGTPTSVGTLGSALDGKAPSDFGAGSYSTSSNPSPWSSVPTLDGSDSCTNPFSYQVFSGVAGTNITFDMCSLVSPAKAILKWFLFAFTAVYMWRRVSSAIGAS